MVGKPGGVLIGQAIGDLDRPGPLWIALQNAAAQPAAAAQSVVADLAFLNQGIEFGKKGFIEIAVMTFMQQVVIDVVGLQFSQALFELSA